MRGRKRGEVPAPLLLLEQRFTAWRRTRSPGERIPKRLWKSAARLAVKYGLNPTAKVLKLDYYSLKEQLDQHEVNSASETFVELPSSSVLSSNECVIELEDGTGASMRVHVKGTVPDVLELGRSFWNAE